MGFKEWLASEEVGKETRPYKKRRLGAITGAAKFARRGGGIASAVNPANLSKAPNSNPAGQVYKGINIAGPIYSQPPKTVVKKQKYFSP